MSAARAHAHELIDKIPEDQLDAAVAWLEALREPDALSDEFEAVLHARRQSPGGLSLEEARTMLATRRAAR